MVLGLLVSLDLALLLPLFTGPEEACDVLRGGLHHGVRLQHFQLAQKLVCEECAEVSEGQMHSGCASFHILNGGPHTTTNILLRVVHVANINLAFDWFTSAFRNGSIISYKLRLINSLSLPVTPAEERR